MHPEHGKLLTWIVENAVILQIYGCKFQSITAYIVKGQAFPDSYIPILYTGSRLGGPVPSVLTQHTPERNYI